MPKVRIYELAREFDLPNREILDKLAQAGIIVRSHSSSVDEDEARAALKSVGVKKKGVVTSTKKMVAEVAVNKGDAAKVAKPGAEAKVTPGPSVSIPSTIEKPSVSRRKGVARKAPPTEGEARLAVIAPPAVSAPAVEARKGRVEGGTSRVVELPTPSMAPRPAPTPAVIRISESLTVKELSELLDKSPSEVIKKLMKMGIMATVNQSVDADVAKTVASKFGFTVEVVALEEAAPTRPEEELPALAPRAPVVTIMGHVDHGKTTLLDAIRHTNVAASEYGEITQHIGAYEVELDHGKVVFLDTPGHEAFTAMRARGAQVTDIVVLVVAADDGVMPQTIEAINHAREAQVPILVAINKIDKPGADPGKVKQQLSEHGLIPEEWGGQTIFVEISAKKRIGIENLLEMILLQAEIMELKANPSLPARGTIIEARLDRGRGPVATVLVQNGTLRVGDAFLAGVHYGKVRAMVDDKGKRVEEVGPSTPVEVFGFSGVPNAGEIFTVAPDERKARMIALSRLQRQREEALVSTRRVSLEDLRQRIEEGSIKELRMIIKGDVQGSVEPLRDSLERIGAGSVKLKVIHSSVGDITESDVSLASASNAIILGFNVKADAKAHKLAQQEGVEIRLYNVIYDAINEVKAAMEGLLEPKYVERVTGRLEVRNLFPASKFGMVAGSYVVEGKVVRDSNMRVLRGGKIVYEGKIDSLRRFKEDVKEVSAGYECGVGIAGFSDLKVGDLIETYELEKVASKL